jgi:hypothetical protein
MRIRTSFNAYPKGKVLFVFYESGCNACENELHRFKGNYLLLKWKGYEYGRSVAATQGDYNNTGIPASAWGLNSGNVTGSNKIPEGSTTKGSNDPCPDGRRVPNWNEMARLEGLTRTVITASGSRKGVMPGGALLMGFHGYYNNSANKTADNTSGFYWSRRVIGKIIFLVKELLIISEL